MLGLHPRGGSAGEVPELEKLRSAPVCRCSPARSFSSKASQLLTSEPFSAQEKSSGRSAHYKLTSTVMLWLQTTKTGSGTMNLGGSLTRQVCGSAAQLGHRASSELRRSQALHVFLQTEKDETVGESSPHIANIGRLVEVS